MILVTTYPSGDNLLVKTSQIPGGAVLNFDGLVFFRYLRGDDMIPAWISAQGEYLTDEALEDLISDSDKTPILTRF